MRERGRRTLALAAASGLLLTGCTLEGDIRIDHDTVTFDLAARHRPDVSNGPCGGGLPDGLRVNDVATEGVEVRCTITGTLPRDGADGGEEPWVQGLLSEVDGTLFLVVPSAYFAGTAHPADLDITMHFPTRILAASTGGVVTGRSVRWTDAKALAATGMAATASDPRPAVPRWLALAALAGAAGVGLGFAGLNGRRGPAGPDAAGSPGPAEPVEPVEPVDEGPDVWSRP